MEQVNQTNVRLNKTVEHLNKTSPEEERQMRIYSGYLLYLLSIDIVIIIPTILGNTLILLSLIRFRHLRSRVNILIGNLAISDLLLGLIFIPYDIAFLHVRFLNENKITCLLRHSMNVALLNASVYNLFCISLERYIAIVHPLRHVTICSMKNISIIVCLGWIFAMLFASVPLMGWNSWHPGVICDNELIWVREYKGIGYLAICTCLITNFIMYIKVMKTAWKQLKNINGIHSKPEADDKKHMSVTKKDVRKTKIMIMVLGIFALCWGPYCIIIILETFVINDNVELIIVKKFFGCLGMLNSGLNWIVYGAKNKKFRHAFKYFLTCGRCADQKSVNLSTTQ